MSALIWMKNKHTKSLMHLVPDPAEPYSLCGVRFPLGAVEEWPVGYIPTCSKCRKIVMRAADWWASNQRILNRSDR